MADRVSCISGEFLGDLGSVLISAVPNIPLLVAKIPKRMRNITITTTPTYVNYGSWLHYQQKQLYYFLLSFSLNGVNSYTKEFAPLGVIKMAEKHDGMPIHMKT